MHVDKQIPAGGGLGGGSADAAAVLRWAGVRRRGRRPPRLGADVPFCLVGGRARVTGIGELLEPLPLERRDLHAVHRRPFAVLDGRRVPGAGTSSAAPTATGPNDLEPAALAVEPRLAAWRDRIREATGRPPVLAGSGATWFVEGAVDRARPTRSAAARPAS